MSFSISGKAVFSSFSGGLNTVGDKYHLPENEFVDGNNMEYGAHALLSKRRGRVQYSTNRLGKNIYNLRRIYIGSNSYLTGSSGERLLLDDDGLMLEYGGSSTPVEEDALRGVVFGNWFYFTSDGGSRYKTQFAVGPVIRNWSIVRGSTITATASGAGGAFPIVTGYSYRLTEIRGSEAESDASPINSVTTSAGADKVIITRAGAADAQTTGFNLYRTFDGGSEYYKHPSSPFDAGDFPYDDTTHDDDLLILQPLDAEYNYPPDIGSDCEDIFSRMVMVDKDTRVLSYSKLGKPEAFPGENEGYTYTLNDGNGTQILRIKRMRNALLCYKNNSVVAVYGLYNESPALFDYRVILEDTGLVAPMSLTSGNGAHWWIGIDNGTIKVCRYDGEKLDIISRKTENLFNRADVEYMKEAVGWFTNNRYYVSFPLHEYSTKNDAIFYYDDVYQAWMPYTKDFGVTAAVVYEGGDDNGEQLVSDRTGNLSYLEVDDAYTDDGIQYFMSLQTRFSGGWHPGEMKKFWDVYAEGNGIPFKVDVVTNSYTYSTHYMTHATSGIWDCVWDCSWDDDGAITKLDDKIAQGIKGRYVSLQVIEDSQGTPLNQLSFPLWDCAWDCEWESGEGYDGGLGFQGVFTYADLTYQAEGRT